MKNTLIKFNQFNEKFIRFLKVIHDLDLCDYEKLNDYQKVALIVQFEGY